MPILREPTEWRRKRPPTRTPSDLEPDEQERVKLILQMVRLRLGSWPAAAVALRAKKRTLVSVTGARGRPTAGLALRAARLLRVPLEDVLSGAFPRPGACPYCGRGDVPSDVEG